MVLYTQADGTLQWAGTGVAQFLPNVNFGNFLMFLFEDRGATCSFNKAKIQIIQ